MKLLTSTLPRVRELLRPSGWFMPGVVVALIGLEMLGRLKTDSDMHDALAMCGLACIAFLIAQRHRLEPFAWLTGLIQLFQTVVRRFEQMFRMELGLDLRGTPPIASKLPPAVSLLAVGLLVWNALALVGWYFVPQGWREWGVSVFYLGYLVGLMSLWVLLLSAVLIGIYVPLTFVLKWVQGDGPSDDTPRYTMAGMIVYLCVLIIAEAILPPVLVMYGCLGVAALLIVGILLPGRSEVQFIWRNELYGKVWSIPSVRMLATACFLGLLFIVGLITSATGGRLIGDPDAESKMPLTVLIGSALTWLTPGLIIVTAGLLGMIWWRNPARQSRTRIAVSGLSIHRREACRILRSWGMQPVWTAKVPRGVVGIQIVDEAQSEATEFDPRWPLRVSIDDLRSGRVRDRLERREELRMRRQFFRGLEKLFKQAAARNSKGGSGYWFVPHLWFVSGLTRDEPEPDDDVEDASILLKIIGTPYHHLYERQVRQYLYRVLRAMQIDLIFVEDGVNHRKLTRVLRALFEVYDRHAGQKRAEEIQFSQVPKVRVVIHEFQIDQPFRSEVYPEPKFEDLGRARILHIFRDRGGEEDPLETPWDFESSPSPMMMV